MFNATAIMTSQPSWFDALLNHMKTISTILDDKSLLRNVPCISSTPNVECVITLMWLNCNLFLFLFVCLFFLFFFFGGGVFSWFNRLRLMRYTMTGISNIQPPLSANIWSQSTNNSLVQLIPISPRSGARCLHVQLILSYFRPGTARALSARFMPSFISTWLASSCGVLGKQSAYCCKSAEILPG